MRTAPRDDPEPPRAGPACGPARARLQARLDGELNPEQAELLGQHLAACALCASLARALTRNQRLLGGDALRALPAEHLAAILSAVAADGWTGTGPIAMQPKPTGSAFSDRTERSRGLRWTLARAAAVLLAIGGSWLAWRAVEGRVTPGAQREPRVARVAPETTPRLPEGDFPGQVHPAGAVAAIPTEARSPSSSAVAQAPGGDREQAGAALSSDPRWPPATIAVAGPTPPPDALASHTDTPAYLEPEPRAEPWVAQVSAARSLEVPADEAPHPISGADVPSADPQAALATAGSAQDGSAQQPVVATNRARTTGPTAAAQAPELLAGLYRRGSRLLELGVERVAGELAQMQNPTGILAALIAARPADIPSGAGGSPSAVPLRPTPVSLISEGSQVRLVTQGDPEHVVPALLELLEDADPRVSELAQSRLISIAEAFGDWPIESVSARDWWSSMGAEQGHSSAPRTPLLPPDPASWRRWWQLRSDLFGGTLF